LTTKGAIIVPLNEEQLRLAVRELLADGAEAIAVAFLWSFRNDAHERRTVEIIGEEAPDVFVTASSQLLPLLGEYERTSTTAINAYLGPIIARYVTNLEGVLRRRWVCRWPLDHGIGWRRAAGRRCRQPGCGDADFWPCWCVLASAALAAQKGWPNVITSDMGGTSFDVGVIVDGEPLMTRTAEVGRFHVALPTISVTAIGSVAAASPP